MRLTVHAVIVGWCLSGTVAAGQAQTALPGPTRSTRAGVYTDAQAKRGRDVYAMMCQSCHTPASHSGPVFTGAWEGLTLWQLFAFVREQMPQNEPGSLTPEEYVLVVAYLLKMNRLPAGETELPADSVALQDVRIEIVPDR